MLRNLNHRIEIVFPVESPALVQRIRNDILEVYLADTANAFQARGDGSYQRAPRSETSGGVDSQQRFMTRRSSRVQWNERL
jgi:polyphosphate kinase